MCHHLERNKGGFVARFRPKTEISDPGVRFGGQVSVVGFSQRFEAASLSTNGQLKAAGHSMGGSPCAIFLMFGFA